MADLQCIFDDKLILREQKIKTVLNEEYSEFDIIKQWVASEPQTDSNTCVMRVKQHMRD